MSLPLAPSSALNDPEEQGRRLREMNQALLVSSIRQHELADQARHDAQASSRQAEAFATLIEQSPFGTYIVDADFRVAHMSAGAMPPFKNVRPLIGRDFAEVVRIIWTEPTAGEIIDIFRRTLETGEPYVSPGLTEHRADVDAIESYEWQTQRITMADGQFGVVCYFFDTTRLRRTEAALRESEAQYRMLFNSMDEGFCIIEFLDGPHGPLSDYVHVEANPACTDNTGIPNIVGRKIREMVPDEAGGWVEIYRKVLLTGEPVRFERELVATGRYLDLSAFRIEPAERRQVAVVFKDVTEHRRFEDEREAHLINEQLLRAEAQTANRAKDLFLATLSHEMRTPLNAIVGWVGILRSEGCQEEDLKEGLDVIERNTHAQVQLIEDVLDVSRIVSSKIRLEMRPCELIEVINAGLDGVRPAAKARGIKLEVRLDPAASRSTCDPARIQQVVWNMVSNAVKFTPAGGTIRVSLSRDQSALMIAVSDTGQGIAPDLLPFVFDRFRQADSSTRRKFGGLGLGLSIVKHLVELHGGTVEAQSPGEGKGSTFIIRLPVEAVRIDEDGEQPSKAEHHESSSDDPAPGRPPVRLDGLRLLIVDDEADARRLLMKMLIGVGAEVTAAASAREALEAIAKSRLDVLVSDLGMPGQDGFDLIREVRKRGHHPRDLPAIALTAFVHKNDAREALLAGFQVHVPKPVDPHDLTAAIAGLAGKTGIT